MTADVASSRLTEMNPVESHCLGKKAFDSPGLALKVAGRPRRDGARRKCYHCPTCGKWHLATTRRRLKRCKPGARRK